MKSNSFKETPEYKNLGNEEKKVFKYAFKKLDEETMKILYFDVENEISKRYSSLSDSSKVLYIDILLKGEKKLEALNYVEEVAMKVSDYVFKLGGLVLLINILMYIWISYEEGVNYFKDWGMYIFIIIQLIIICGLSDGFIKKLLKSTSYTKAKILGTVISFMPIVIFFIYMA